MILGHELTHIRYGQLPEDEADRVVDFYATSWGNVHSFAATLMSRDEYRRKVLSGTAREKVRNPNMKTRSVVVDGERYEVGVSEIVNELLAYRTATGLVGEDRIRELARVNPTKENPSREALSVLAHDTFQQIKSSGKLQSIPGEELYTGLRSAVDMVKQGVAKLR